MWEIYFSKSKQNKITFHIETHFSKGKQDVDFYTLLNVKRIKSQM